MYKKFQFLVFFLCFFSTSTFAQNIVSDGGFILFREAKTKEPVLIINDSLLYKGIKLIKLPFKHTDYPEELQEYIPYNIKDKTYLVHNGCGPVLEFRNDSIVRINDAYLQRNQYGAVHFVYKNEIYFFGGYGLFTTKNILTKYIFKTKDWIQVQTRGEKAQEPREGAYCYIKGDDLYVFGGQAHDVDNIPNGKLLDDKVWRLHLPTMRWDYVGNYDQKTLGMNPGFLIYGSNKIVFLSGVFSEIDYNANTLSTYEINNFKEPLSAYIEGDKIIGFYRVRTKSFFHVSDINEFRGKLKSTTVFISPLEPNLNYLVTSSASFLVLILLLYLFRKQLNAIMKPFKGIIYNHQKSTFWYKGKLIISFDEQDKKVLLYLLEHLDQYVSLNELNQLFENYGGVETFSATIKRREQAVNSLLIKVSKLTGIDEKELALERKNAEDKRIKDIMLLPKLLKRI